MTGRPRRNGADWSKIADGAIIRLDQIYLSWPGARVPFPFFLAFQFLERLLRVVQRIGFREATIVAESVESLNLLKTYGRGRS